MKLKRGPLFAGVLFGLMSIAPIGWLTTTFFPIAPRTASGIGMIGAVVIGAYIYRFEEQFC